MLFTNFISFDALKKQTFRDCDENEKKREKKNNCKQLQYFITPNIRFTVNNHKVYIFNKTDELNKR